VRSLRRATFELEEFEAVQATSDSVLLRIAGRWTGDPGECELVARNGNGPQTLDALPPLPASGETWRAAFSATPHLVEHDDVDFKLVPKHGRRVRLPRPATRTPKSAAGPARERERFVALLESANERGDRLERALATERELAAGRLLALRSTGRKLGKVQARIEREVETRTAAARASERRALDEVSRLRGRVAQLEGIVGRLVVGVEEGEKRLAVAEQRGNDLRLAIDRLPAGALNVAAIRETLDARIERLMHLERQAKALSAAIHERIAGNPRDPGQEQLFDAPVDEQTPVPA
jgi:transcriptional regulator